VSQEDKTVLIDNVKLDEGVSQKTGKPYKRVRIAWNGEDGSEKFASAFGDSLYTPAKALEGDKAVITIKQNGNFLDLLAVRPAPKEPAEKLGTGEYVSARKPPIEARRIYASTAWNCAARMAQADLGYDAAKNLADKIFHDLLVKGKAIEDEDIPF